MNEKARRGRLDALKAKYKDIVLTCVHEYPSACCAAKRLCTVDYPIIVGVTREQCSESCPRREPK